MGTGGRIIQVPEGAPTVSLDGPDELPGQTGLRGAAELHRDKWRGRCRPRGGFEQAARSDRRFSPLSA